MLKAKTRVAEVNAAVEEDVEDYSDEVDEEDDEEVNDEMDTSSRLVQPLSYNRTLLELYQLLKDERYMNINPDYQRDVVWSENRMVHLIDSLFNNYYVPPLIFKAVTGVKEGTNERRKWRTCIDGKQRLTTIRKFFDGEIPYIDKQRRKWYYSTPTDSKKVVRLLSDEDREFFNNINIVNIEFEYLNEEQEEDMFQRVQLGVPLTVAEKLAALSGLIPSFINDLRKAYTRLPALVGTKRSNDFKLVASLVYLMYCRIDEDEDLKLKTTQASLRKFVDDPNPATILTPTFRAQARRVFSRFDELVQTYPDVFTHNFGHSTAKMRRFSPVEFLGVGIMLDAYSDRPTRVFAEDIKAFREFLRERLQDLRTNSATWIHVMDFINRLEHARGYYPPENDQSSKRMRVNGMPTMPQQRPTFNPPTPERQIHSQPMSVYNEQQQRAMEARLAHQRQEQQQAFRTIPTARTHGEVYGGGVAGQVSGGRPPGYAGGVQERSVNGGQKRAYNGVTIKREI